MLEVMLSIFEEFRRHSRWSKPANETGDFFSPLLERTMKAVCVPGSILGILLSFSACIASPSIDLVMPVHSEGCGGYDAEALLIGMKTPNIAVFAVAATPIRNSTDCNPRIFITTPNSEKLEALSFEDQGDYVTFMVRAKPPPREI